MEGGEKNCRRYFNISIAVETTADTPSGYFAALCAVSELPPNQGFFFEVWLFVKPIEEGSFDSYDLQLSHLTEYTLGGFGPFLGWSRHLRAKPN